ncbi:MAG: hypothetical protein JKY65_10945 [Planctomycetes bacterium]|nr:hypothetical protein [Planctomycetota bacterium]
MTFRSLFTAALLLVGLATPSLAQRAGAVLMVEDNEVTEKIGVAAYAPFLEQAGVYSKVITVTGRERANERLAAAIRRLAAENDFVDVIVSVHTTHRSPEVMERLIPKSARKLRLVYSTACYGASVERPAWERLGAQTIVTHVGINNPLVALPYFLSRWIQGEAVGPIVSAGYREEALTSRFFLSLPGVGDALNGLYGDGGNDKAPFLTGSRPVLSGRKDLTIRSGLGKVRLARPKHLRYSRSTGGSPGLAARAMAGRYQLESGDLQRVLGLMRIPETPWLPQDLLRGIRVTPVYRRRDVMKPTRRGARRRSRRRGSPVAGRIEVKLARKQSIPLERGLKLKVGKIVTLQVARIDAEARTLRLKVTGLWVAKGVLRYRITSLTVKPDGDAGYKVTIGGGVWGVIPYWISLPLGGARPDPLPADLDVVDARDYDPRPGLLKALGLALAPTQQR